MTPGGVSYADRHSSNEKRPSFNTSSRAKGCETLVEAETARGCSCIGIRSRGGKVRWAASGPFCHLGVVVLGAALVLRRPGSADA